jgi:hypothetical protein
MCSLSELHKIFLTAPFGTHAALLIELAKVPDIINVIAIALWGRSFATRWQPDVIDADGFEGIKL